MKTLNTPEKEKELTKRSIDKAVFVRAMTEMLMQTTSDQIKIPTKFRDQALLTKELLRNDASGIVNTVLDFAITCALVDYTVETSNENLTEIFNTWLSSINSELRGQIPVGLNSLAKQYFLERWKGSSFLLLRSVWEVRDGYILPTKLWFVNGEDIVIENNNDTFAIGTEKYSLRISQKLTKSLPASKDEKIFIQKPYESWGTAYPTPFVIRRGLFKNLRFLDILTNKGEYIVGKALEYLLLLKKGSEQLAMANQAEFIYSEADLKKVKEYMEELISNRKSVAGTPTYATNFDTEISHLIPDYDKALKQELFTPVERRILAGLGLVDVLQGVSSTRRESTLNPRPFIAEVEQGIEDFKLILSDLMETIIILNRVKHPKFVGQIQKIHSAPISHFITDDIRTQLRSMYDRGVISMQTYSETCGEVDFVVEVNRRELEKGKLETLMAPHPIAPEVPVKEALPKEDTTPDKTGPEKKNFKGEAELEEANIDLPEEVKALPLDAQRIWKSVYAKTVSKGANYASKVAWTVTKKFYKKEEAGWSLKKKIKSSTGMIALSTANLDEVLEDVMQLQEIELKEAQLKLAKRLLSEKEE